VIRGLGANDYISADSGEDDVDGGVGIDRVRGGTENDDAFGPNDVLSELEDFTTADDGPNTNPFA
jgi:hypothetical protein